MKRRSKRKKREKSSDRRHCIIMHIQVTMMIEKNWTKSTSLIRSSFNATHFNRSDDNDCKIIATFRTKMSF